MTNKQIIKEGIEKYPNAVSSYVVRFTSKYNGLTSNAVVALGEYPQNQWNEDTIQAIIYILTQKTLRQLKG